MPTVLDLGFCRIVIYPNDHRPAHVHVVGGDWEAVFELNCPDGPPVLRESYEVTAAILRRVTQALNNDLANLCSKWTSIHGNH